MPSGKPRYLVGLVVATTAVILAGCGGPAPSHPTRTGAPSQHPRTRHTPAVKSQPPVALAPGLGGAVSVIVENDPAARPESGLSRADWVFEAPAEGGITRFLAIFWSRAAGVIGPVRSTRIYFDQLARAYRLPFAHAGGNVDALYHIPAWHIENFDQIYGSGAYFWRSTSRLPPHNLYTSTALLAQGIRHRHEPFGPVPTLPPGTMPGHLPATQVAITYANQPGVFVERPIWNWVSGVYVRTENGVADPTASGAPITARAIIVLVTPASPDPDPYTPYSIKLAMTGRGPGWVFENGRATPIIWKRRSASPFAFETVHHHDVKVPGTPVWFELVPSAAQVAFH